MKIEKISDLLEKNIDDRVSVFSFDIFDTLITRTLPPEYLKLLTCKYIINIFPEYTNGLSLYDIMRRRVAIEETLKKQSIDSGCDYEYRFHDCIENLTFDITGKHDQNFVSTIKEFEVSLEKASIELCEGAVDVLKKIKSSGKKIICISDMYLGGEIISDILKDKGLHSYIDVLYVSSDYGKRKDTGRLYHEVLKRENIDVCNIIHIGDNEISDYRAAISAGLTAIYLCNDAEKKRHSSLDAVLKRNGSYESSLQSLFSALMKNLSTDKGKPENITANTFAVSFYSYVASMIDYCSSKGIKNIYFLSREGLFFKKIFDIINTTEIKGYYFCASRISLYPLSVSEINEKTLDELIYFIKVHDDTPVSISQIFKMLKIEYDLSDIMCECGVNKNTLFDLSNEHDKDVLKSVVLDKRIRDAFSKAKQEYTVVFKKYLEELDFLGSETVMVADIGWSGSMQTYLQKILKDNGYIQKIEGFYFCYDRFMEMYKNKNNYSPGRKQGYFQYPLDAVEPIKDESDVLNRIPLEFITSANHGTVISYEEDSGSVKPVYMAHVKEMRQHERYIAPIQEQVLLFIRRFIGILSLLTDIYGQRAVYEYNLEKCASFFIFPDKKIAEFNSHLVLFDDSFGKPREVKFHQIIWWHEAYALVRKKYWHERIRSLLKLKEYIYNVERLRNKIGWNIFFFVAWQKIRGKKINSLEFRLAEDYSYQPHSMNFNDKNIISYIYMSVCDSFETAKLTLLLRQLLKQNNGEKKLILCSGKGVELITCFDYNRYEIKSLSPTAVIGILLQYDYLVTLEFNTLLDSNFELLCAEGLRDDKKPDLIYFDNDNILNDGHFGKPEFKTDWAEEYFLEYDYIRGVCAVRTSVIAERAGTLIDTYKKYATRGILLDFLERIKNVYHVPSIAYHAVENRRYGYAPLVNDYLKRNGIPAKASRNGKERNNVRYVKRDYGKVSIIIPFKDQVELLKQCVTSILSRTDYENYEIVLVNNQSKERKTLKYLGDLRHNAVRIMDFDQPFNYSEINNYAVSNTNGEYVLFLNNDTKVLNADWLLRMLEQAAKSDVGCVGAKLFYPDGSIQHAGVIFDFSFIYPANHIFHRECGNADGYMKKLKTVQRYSAVTAACLLMRRNVFLSVGGFDKDFKVSYNDLDLCCRLNEKGLKIIWTPHARLVHYENASRGNPADSTMDCYWRDKFRNNWARFFQAGDPYYSPHIDLFGNTRY